MNKGHARAGAGPADQAGHPERWQLVLVGRPRLAQAGREVPLSRKDAGWLAYVALSGGAASAQVALLLWPEGDLRGALNNLRQRVHRLRRATGARLVEVAEAIALGADLRAPGEPDRRLLERDPAAWDGELLGSHVFDDAPDFADWLAAARQAWRDTRRDALAAIASEAEAARRLARALVYAQRLVAEDPLSEHAHRRLMRLHYLRGDRAAAVAAYEACERVLKDELGVRPDTETLDLLSTIDHGAAPTVALPARAAPPPARLQRPPRLIGREAEWQRLAEAIAEGAIVWLVGAAGIGKSRLLQEFAALAECGTLLQLSARLGDASRPGALGTRLAESLRPGVAAVLLDDLQFADRESLLALPGLADDPARTGMAWVLALRPEDTAALQGLVGSLRLRRIELRPLDLVALEALVASLGLGTGSAAALAGALARHVGGNPQFVLETLRAMKSPEEQALPRPEGVVQAIGQRLARLPEQALAIARLAAIAGPDFSPALAEQAFATPALVQAGAWAELEAADVLCGTVVSSALVGEALRRSTPRPIAAHAHRAVAEQLVRSGAEPERVAGHWRAGDEPRRAALAYRTAAERARRAGLPREEARLWREAASAHEAAGETEDALEAGAWAIAPTVRSAGPSAALAASEALLPRPTRRHAGLVRATHAAALLWAGRAAEAEAAGRAALELISPRDEPLRLEATRTVAIARGMAGDPAGGIELLLPWLVRLDHLPRLDQRIEFCGAYTHLLLQAHRLGEAMRVAARHQALARQAGDRLEELTAVVNLCAAAVRRGELDAAIAAAEAAAALDPADDQSRMLAGFNEGVHGLCLCAAGRYREGLQRLESALSDVGRLAPGSPFEVSIAGYLALIHLQLGQVARARRLLAPEVDGLAPHLRANRLLGRALCASREAEALALLAQAGAEAGHGQGEHVRLVAQLEIARRSPPAEAARIAAEVAAVAHVHELRPLAVLADALRLLALQRSGQQRVPHEEIAALEARADAHRAPYPYLPELLLLCSQLHEGEGAEDDARRCRDTALAWVHRQALPNLPAELHAGFLERNPVNRRLRALAARCAGQRRHPISTGGTT